MPEPIILASARRWSGALRRKLTGDPAFAPWLAAAAQHPVSRQRIHQWHEELRPALRAGAATSSQPDAAPSHRAPDSGLNTDTAPAVSDVRQILRRLRERVFYTLMVRDINGSATLLEVVTAMTTLADLSVAQAYRSVMAELVTAHGMPRDPRTGRPQEMLIVGMGKLGGRELNVSSDIDLVMLYGRDGTTSGPAPLSHHEFYGRVTRRMMPVLSEHDAHGYVFRCDLRLRPDGSSGPLAWSLPALEKYLLGQGREWERYAWIKARVIHCRAFADSDPRPDIQRLEALRVPFVYRKYFDFDALASLRDLRSRIREDWERRARSRSGLDKTHNIKLGDGGIREIEFVVQLNQLIRGGRLPSLQQRGLHPALYKQKKAGVLAETVADRLESAYFFLRRVEHMLQYREDEQTHMLPGDEQLRQGLASAMGQSPDEFESRLASHRQDVEDTFRNAFRIAGMGNGDTASAASPSVAQAAGTAGTRDATEAGRLRAELAPHIETLLASRRMRSLPPTSRRRLEALLPRLVNAAADCPEPATTAIRLLDLVDHIASRSAYLALLAEYPDTLKRLARIVSASPWAAGYLTRYPLLLDSLIEWNTLLTAPDFDQLAEQLRNELDACLLPDGQPDVEQQMNLMRDMQHQVTFRLLAQDLEGNLSVEALADHLSALADMLLEETIRRVWPLVQPRGVPMSPAQPDGDPQDGDTLPAPRFAVIGYGKLGGKELGYASDLDLVFLYDDPDHEAGEIYTRLGRRMSSWLSTLTSSGRLYEVDLRLRPDGDAGLLAVTIDAFENYQRHHAWAWEHQAITRARFVAGDTAIGTRFETLRQDILLLERDLDTLRADVRTMRDKISAAHPNAGPDFDIKHDRGGMVDVEFVIQYLVLGHARHHPELLGNLGNITLLNLAGKAGLIPQTLAAGVANAYRTYRQRQHALRLQGAERALVPGNDLAAERETVLALWNTVLED